MCCTSRNIEAHDPLVEALVTEAWERLERFEMNVLSVFSACLGDQHLYHSPLMGKIADIVNRNLETIQDLRSLSNLMVNISGVISQCFQEKLVNKAELLFDTTDTSNVNISRRLVQFLRNAKYCYYPLLERCNKVFLSNVNYLDLEFISKILSLYQVLQFHSFEFIIMARKRLSEMIPLSEHPESFVRLFVTLGPIAGPEEKEQLQSILLLMSEELTGKQALAVVTAMEVMESRNSHLIKKIASVLYKYLDNYKPLELLKITQALIFLQFQSKELFVKLRELLLSSLKVSVTPNEVFILVCAISMLPSPHISEEGTSRIEAVLPQCCLRELDDIASSVLRWIQYDRKCLARTTGKQLKLLQKIDFYGLQRLQQRSFDLFWKELKKVKGGWLFESLLEETVDTLYHSVDEINYRNVSGIASFISRTQYLSSLLLDRIASVVVQQIEKIHPFSILPILLPFSLMNYDPPQRDEFFGTCIQCINSYLGILDPLVLVFLGLSLSSLGYFPEELLKTIFNIKFLARFDSQLEILGSSLRTKAQFRLMELNRAVCLECPELEVPWFHERFCQQYFNKDIGNMNSAQQEIYRMLADILGGVNYVKASILSPYYYTIGFECILDKRKRPLPYGNRNVTMEKLPGKYWELSTQIVGSELPPGAERIAFEFLDSRAFCKNIPHIKGKSAMKKRHLEILGYHVIQIPHFEWNSMAMSKKEARIKYLREHIFGTDRS
ncbi:FAST kinase domain-containing protein 1, mitochondrial isoform 2-T2 [Thomomys bottae]